MRVALLALLFAPCAAAEPQIQAVLPDLSGTWLATTKSVLSMYRHQHECVVVCNLIIDAMLLSLS